MLLAELGSENPRLRTPISRKPCGMNRARPSPRVIGRSGRLSRPLAAADGEGFRAGLLAAYEANRNPLCLPASGRHAPPRRSSTARSMASPTPRPCPRSWSSCREGRHIRRLRRRAAGGGSCVWRWPISLRVSAPATASPAGERPVGRGRALTAAPAFFDCRCPGTQIRAFRGPAPRCPRIASCATPARARSATGRRYPFETLVAGSGSGGVATLCFGHPCAPACLRHLHPRISK